jgi:hypothetical protein
MKLTKMPNPRKPVHSPGAKQIFVIEFPPPSPTPKISLLSAISDAKPGVNSYAKPGVNSYAKPGVNSYDGAASPVKRPQLKMETPPKVPEDSSRAKWEKFIEIQQDRPYKRLPFKKPRNA